MLMLDEIIMESGIYKVSVLEATYGGIIWCNNDPINLEKITFSL